MQIVDNAGFWSNNILHMILINLSFIFHDAYKTSFLVECDFRWSYIFWLCSQKASFEMSPLARLGINFWFCEFSSFANFHLFAIFISFWLTIGQIFIFCHISKLSSQGRFSPVFLSWNANLFSINSNNVFVLSVYF